jgi:hypothetical protein
MKPSMQGVLVICALALKISLEAHGVGDEMADAAQNFLAALSDEQRGKAVFELKSDERLNWHFIPKERKGLPIKEMAGEQRALANVLLSSGLSHRGYFKASTIISLEQILHDIEKGKGPVRDPERYFFSIFGKPESHGAWGWRVEGHHLALNFTISGDDVSVTPNFMGTNPAEAREGPRKGLRVLGVEEDLARTLVKALDDDQKKIAIYTNTAPSDIITGAERKARVLEPKGISMAKLGANQKEMLLEIVKEYVYRARPELAEKEFTRIRQSSPEEIHFAWAGSIERGAGHYYRVQGPGFLIEYDNTQNNANHVHAVWRDLKNDFGEDILRNHYDEAHSKK